MGCAGMVLTASCIAADDVAGSCNVRMNHGIRVAFDTTVQRRANSGLAGSKSRREGTVFLCVPPSFSAHLCMLQHPCGANTVPCNDNGRAAEDECQAGQPTPQGREHCTRIVDI